MQQNMQLKGLLRQHANSMVMLLTIFKLEGYYAISKLEVYSADYIQTSGLF